MGDTNDGSVHWRFEDLVIWQLAADLAVNFHRLAGNLHDQRMFRYAEQLRAAGLSVSNNIAEGSASVHRAEFVQFLNIARRSLFEDVSMLLVFKRMGLLSEPDIRPLLEQADVLSRKLSRFTQTKRQPPKSKPP